MLENPCPPRLPHNLPSALTIPKESKVGALRFALLQVEFPQIGKLIGLIEEHQPEAGILKNTDDVQKELGTLKARLKEENNLKILESIVGTWTLTSSTNVSEYLNGADEESHKKWLQGNVKPPLHRNGQVQKRRKVECGEWDSEDLRRISD